MEKLERIKRAVENLQRRNIEAKYVRKEEVIPIVAGWIPFQATIGMGNSRTLKELRIYEWLTERGHRVYDKTRADLREERQMLKKSALLADWYVTGTNGLAATGQLVNVDHSGNRGAALLFGPEHVLVIVGENKLVETVNDAIWRARNIAAPQNAARVGADTPCRHSGYCVDCQSEERVCHSLIVVDKQENPNRMKVLIVNEAMGF